MKTIPFKEFIKAITNKVEKKAEEALASSISLKYPHLSYQDSLKAAKIVIKKAIEKISGLDIDQN